MPSSLIQATLAAGESLARAVESQDYERATALAAARGTLVERLLAETTPLTHTAEEVEALTAQDKSLAALLITHEKSLRDAFSTLVHHRQANASYGSALPRPSILQAVHG